MSLRVLYKKSRIGTTQQLDIFEGDIEKDRRYWKKHQNIKAQYFELGKEIK